MVGAAILNQIAVAGPEAFTADELEPRQVRVFPDGTVAIAGAGAALSSLDGEPREVLKAAGRLLCAALGVGTEPNDEPGFTAAEAVALPLVLHARAMAVGAVGTDPVGALRTYLERAGRLGSPERLECSREELGALVSRLLHSPAPIAKAGPSSPDRLPPSRRRWTWRLPVAAGLVLVLGAGGAVLLGGAVRPQPQARLSPKLVPALTAPPSAPVNAAPAVSPAAAPLQVPVFALPAAPPIRSVTATTSTPCSAGGRCGLDLAITFQPARTNLRFAWKLEIFDACTGTTVERSGGSFAAQPGWSHIQVASSVQVPASKAPVIVVVTTAPSAVQSAPIPLQPVGTC